MNSFKTRNAKRDEINFFISMAKDEGWNPGITDHETFWLADTKGFFVGEIKDKIIGCISAVKYNNFGFIGLYIVLPEYRHRGYGMLLWNKALEYLNNINTGLDGVIAQIENYKKSGFSLAHKNFRYEYRKTTNIDVDFSDIYNIEDIDFEQLKEYDRLHFPSNRNEFLSEWCKKNKTYIFKQNHIINGYVTVRECVSGCKIGPLFARDFYVAEKLFLVACSIDNHTNFYLDIIENNQTAIRLVDKYQMNLIFETARMYSTEIPNINWQEVIGITTFELG